MLLGCQRAVRADQYWPHACAVGRKRQICSYMIFIGFHVQGLTD